MPTTLDPQLLAATRGLTLAARGLVAGILPGLHASRQPGMAREFAQYRAYQPGDEPRHIDWKLYARSDRYFVRESEIETAINIRLILDATASMRHADTSNPSLNKFDLARLLAAALALLAAAQGDQVGLHAVGGEGVVSVLPGQHRQPTERILRILANLRPSGRWPAGARRALQAAFAAGTPRGSGGDGSAREIVVVLTDGHEQDDEIRAALAPLRSCGHELLLFQLVGRDEEIFPFRGLVRFEDWETGAAFETNADAARAVWVGGYEQRLRAWRRDWEGGGRFDVLRFLLDEPPGKVLRAYLKKRQK